MLTLFVREDPGCRGEIPGRAPHGQIPSPVYRGPSIDEASPVDKSPDMDGRPEAPRSAASDASAVGEGRGNRDRVVIFPSIETRADAPT